MEGVVGGRGGRRAAGLNRAAVPGRATRRAFAGNGRATIRPQEGGGHEANAVMETVDLSGQSLGEFVLLRRLGQGGMGQVYLAEQPSLRRRVALKLLRKELASNEISRRRFEAEAKAVAQLSHANIVQ